jgi:three-Cys-motif partner protein
MTPRRVDYVIQVQDDGRPTQAAGEWTIEKYRRMGYYADLFSTGMKNLWGRRVYVDLYAGAGYTRINATEDIILGSPLIAMTIRDRFDRYILCDKNPESIEALEARVKKHAPDADVEYVTGDVNECVDEVVGCIPTTTNPRDVLTFCFVDPYDISIAFGTIRKLAVGRDVDFLTLLALGMDARRNVGLHPERIDSFLGDDEWRRRWKIAEVRQTPFNYLLAKEYSERMQRLGYLPTRPEDMCSVKSDKNAPLYYLALFSRAQAALKFWKEVQKYAPEQTELRLPF